MVDRAVATGHVSARVPILRKDGGVRQIRLDVIRMDDGRLLGHMFDESAQHAAEQALRESEERFRRLADAAQDGVVLLDGAGAISYWNPAAERILGHTGAEALGKDVHALLAPSRYGAACTRGMAGFRESGTGAAVGRTVELTALHKDGRGVPVELSVSALRMGDEWHAVGLLRDISERKRMEVHVRQRQRLASIGTLAAGIAHEVNNPVAAIVTCAHLLLEEAAAGSQVAEDARSIVEECERIERIVERFRAFARPEASGPAAELDVREVVDAALGLVAAPLRSAGIDVRRDFADDTPPIAGHAARLQQVFVNLLTNAWEALDERYPRGGEEKVLRLSAGVFRRDERSWVRLTVEDRGGGIAEDALEHVFDPFFSGRTTGDGSGLGLWAAREIVDEHGGSLHVESRPGGPTRFHVELPASLP